MAKSKYMKENKGQDGDQLDLLTLKEALNKIEDEIFNIQHSVLELVREVEFIMHETGENICLNQMLNNKKTSSEKSLLPKENQNSPSQNAE